MGKANSKNKAKKKKLIELTALHKRLKKCKDESDKQQIQMKINSIKSKI